MMKKLPLTLFLLFILSVSAARGQRQAIDLFLLRAPRTVLPLIDSLSRAEMLERFDAGKSGVAENTLGGQSTLTSRTNHTLSIKLTDVSTWQMRLLLTAQSDTLIATIHTLHAGGASSALALYDKHWRPLHQLLPQPAPSHFILVSDSLSQPRNQHLASVLAQVPIEATWATDEPIITYNLSIEGLSLDDQADAPHCLRPLRYQWNGTAFLPLTD